MMKTNEQGGDMGRSKRAWRPASVGVMFAAVLAMASMALAFHAAAASAGVTRSYDSKITPFNSPTGVGFESNGDVWFSDHGQFNNPPGQGGIYKYSSYPSQTLLAAPNTYIPWAYYVLAIQIAVDQESGDVYVAQANGREVDIFDEEGKFLKAWTSINGTRGGEGIHVAVDNSSGNSRGRVYLSLTSPEDRVEAVESSQKPVEFPATASYIDGNRLTGTPDGPFGQVENISVDDVGNIYVTDASKKVVDEFDPTGTFLRAFPAPRASAESYGGGGVGIDPTNGNVIMTEGSEYGGEGGASEYDAYGNFLGKLPPDIRGPYEQFTTEGTPGVDANGYAYLPASNRVDIYKPAPAMPTVNYHAVTNPSSTGGTLNATVNPNGGANVTSCRFEYGTTTAYGVGSIPCTPDAGTSSYSTPTDISAPLSGLTTETTYHYRVVVQNADGTRYGADQTYTPHFVVGLTTEPATNITENSATLNASLVGDGTATTYYFEWGSTTAYSSRSSTPPGSSAGSPSGPGATSLPFEVTGLEPYKTYHYRVVAVSGGHTSYGEDMMFTTLPGVPTIEAESSSEVHSDKAVLHARINPNGGRTGYHFEYVPDAEFQSTGWTNATRVPSSDVSIGMGKEGVTVELAISGLHPGTTYHYRAVGTNVTGVGTPSFDRTFTTFPYGFSDTCPNAHVRQQTGSALLLDCRAYELASAENAGGYDVESDLVVGQDPYGGYPYAEHPSQLLYGVHNGGIPGTGNPTNKGVDPYVATRGENGWTTEYVGIPANDPSAHGTFASTLEEANAGLNTFAFGGPEICSPCFPDGSTGTPIHMPDGSLVQGMAGSLDPGPSAEAAGFIGRHLSADGIHYVFGSTAQFEEDGNNNGDISIYDRNLETGVTHVVSKTPGGETMTGPGIGELDISRDGSRIVIGQLVSTDSAGNRYWHLYMNIGDSGQTIDLTPGTTTGALYDGMTADGSQVYFTTRDQLTGDDSDHSTDIYRAEVTTTGTDLSRVSTGSGGSGNTDACEPAGNTIRSRWNNVAGEENCDAVAVGGGGGVASGDGTIFFLSPERLDNSNPENLPVQDAPNLYVAKPGAEPHFVRTLESTANAQLPSREHPFVRTYGGFTNPTATAIEAATGDVYVTDVGTDIGPGAVFKFDESGHAVQSFGINGKLDISGAIGFYNVPSGMAVDNDPTSPTYTDLFVPAMTEEAVRVYNSEGHHVGDIKGLSLPDAVAVSPATGDVYVTEQFGGVRVYHYSTVTEAWAETSSFSTPAASNPTGVAVDSNGNVFVVNGGGFFGAQGTAEEYDSSGNHVRQVDANPSSGVSVDPADDHIYVDEGNLVREFDQAGNQVTAPIGQGIISSSVGVAVNEGTVQATNRGSTNMATFGPTILPSDPHTDNPLVIDSVGEAGTRQMGDFQVTPSGKYAVFTSTLSLSGYPNVGHREVYRYDISEDSLSCPSCNPTGEDSTGDATLPKRGLGLSDDGRVFFNSTEGLVDRDLNNKLDAYEWEPGHAVELISTGTSPANSSLLGISADATDAYFFTRDALVSNDFNGNRVKIYDARVEGGFPYVPPAVPCKASDECHGPSSQSPGPPAIGTIAGTPLGNVHKAASKCKPHHHCRKRHRHHRRHHSKHAKGKRHG